MNRRTLVVVVFLAITVNVCLAGELWEYKCVNPKCNFSGSLEIGGGFVFEAVTGYCTKCKEFVSIRWKKERLTGDLKQMQAKMTNLVENTPQQLGSVWNPITGITANLYPCPKCKEAFMDIGVGTIIMDNEWGKRFCPHCMKPTLTMERHGTFD